MNKTKLLPIYYSGFWDVPMAFLTVYKEELFLFRRGTFDEELDDYPPNYTIRLVKNISLDEAYGKHPEIPELISFTNYELLLDNPIIGEVKVKDVVFDRTNRKFINAKIFKKLKLNEK